jgi:hypothetical protein
MISRGVAMDLTGLATLKEKLIQANQFSDVWRYFMDHFGGDDEFMGLGERAHHAFLEAVLVQVGEALLKRKVTLSGFLMNRLAEQQFIHGGGLLNDKLANVLYFEDIQKGLLAVVVSVSPSETKMIRFTGRPLPNHWHRSDN